MLGRNRSETHYVMDATQRELAAELESFSIDRWGPFVEFAIRLVFASDALCELLTTEWGRRVQLDCAGRTDADYERYYRSSVALACELPLEYHGFKVPRFVIRFAARANANRPETFRQTLPRVLWLGRVFNLFPLIFGINKDKVSPLLKRTIEECVTGGPTDATEEAYQRDSGLPSASFLLRVYLPCLARYQQTPQDLFTAATSKAAFALEAVEKLIECDPRIIYLPAIRQVLESNDRQLQSERYTALGKGLYRELALPTTGELKNSMAGCISHLAKLTGKPITASQIQRLFDIAAKCRGNEIDQDLGAIQPTSFAANVRNRRKPWEWVLAERGMPEAFRALRTLSI